MLRRSEHGLGWRGAGCFLLIKNGILHGTIICIYIQLCNLLAAWCHLTVIILLYYCPANLSPVTWRCCVPVLQVSVDLSRVNKKNCFQSWDWSPIITSRPLLLTFYHLQTQAESQMDFFLSLLKGTRTKYINWIGVWQHCTLFPIATLLFCLECSLPWDSFCSLFACVYTGISLFRERN